MAVYNTPSDAANTAVRSFLTSVGELYLQKSFNTGSGTGKALWEKIKTEFGFCCAYCDKPGAVQIEHLVMFNRAEYGLHHPGNIVPICTECNKRSRDSQGKYTTWILHLALKCGGATTAAFAERKSRIEDHIARYQYPNLTVQEKHALRVIAEALYDNIKSEAEKSLRMYRSLDEAFIARVPAAQPEGRLRVNESQIEGAQE
jgi:hypothetical protein